MVKRRLVERKDPPAERVGHDEARFVGFGHGGGSAVEFERGGIISYRTMPLMKRRHLLVTLLWLAAASAAGAQTGPAASQASPTGPTGAPFWTGMSDAASFERAMNARLAHARTRLDQLVGSAQQPGARGRSTTRSGPTTTCCSSSTRCHRRRNWCKASTPRSASGRPRRRSRRRPARSPRNCRSTAACSTRSAGSTRAARTRRRSISFARRCATSAWPAWTKTRPRASASKSCATSSCSSGRTSTGTSAPISAR